MRHLLNHAPLTSAALDPPIAFEYERPEHSALPLRYLCVNGARAFDLSVQCDTCPLLFERIGGVNPGLFASALAQQLRDGVAALTPEIMAAGSLLLPAGPYHALLLRLAPALAGPGAANDYFAHEQLDLWRIEDMGGAIHNPQTAYYRTPAHMIGHGAALYECVVPLLAPAALDQATVSAYQERLAAGEQPAALAFSVLDVKQPDSVDLADLASAHGAPAITRHWCLTHFVLDGHHKLAAAARNQQPIHLVSFLAVAASTATEDQIATLLRTLEDNECVC